MQRGITKAFFNGKNFLNDIAIVKAQKEPFCIITSNYTMEIVSEHHNVGYIQNMSSQRANMGAKMIERDIKATNFDTPEINKHDLTYNQFAPFERLKSVGNDIYCIDIKQAYLTVLYNKGLITKETYRFGSTVAKKDRLAMVGMLAANRKYIFHNEHGEKVAIESEENLLSAYFHLCVLETNNIMMHIKTLLGADNFIFYWVDGIYFEREEAREEVSQYLTQMGFKFTFEKLQQFKIVERKDSYLISYWQTKTPEANRVAYPYSVKKRFPVRKDDQETRKQILEILGLHHEKHSIIKNFKTSNGKRIN